MYYVKSNYPNKPRMFLARNCKSSSAGRFTAILLLKDSILTSEFMPNVSSVPLLQIRCLRSGRSNKRGNKKEDSDNKTKSANEDFTNEFEKLMKKFRAEIDDMNKEYKEKTGKNPPVNFKMISSQSAQTMFFWTVGWFVGVAFLFNLLSSDKRSPVLVPQDLSAPRVTSNTFIEKYLKSGEVQRITIIPDQKMAIASMHQGAIIDNIPLSGSSVIIEFSGLMDLVKFKNEVSQEEERLGINQNARVPIDVLEKTRGKGFVLFLLSLLLLLFLPLLLLFLSKKKFGSSAGTKKT